MYKKLHTLVIGSGASGLAAACHLHRLGITDLAIYTEGLKMGTSINTGSDKQTYYKVGMYGAEADAPGLMAQDLASGGAMHGDIALIEAALSAQGFYNLVNLGVPFPHDEFGEYIGYKTDHDPKRRATSCGPYTSRAMCEALTAEIKRRGIEVQESQVAVKILTDDRQERVIGAIFIHRTNGEFTVVQAENVVFATGGPGGLYASSVYPKVHTGGIGLALAAGAKACNLAESQFGLASIKFRWNVSGSYMQVLPRFISTDADGRDEKEFLREYFPTTEAMYDAIFLKGYQWPFAAGHVPGSSLIDIYTYIETVERGRRVFLDFRSDPEDIDFDKLSAETREYLINSEAWDTTPLARLNKLNAPAIELYRDHGIDLSREALEIAVCAQHNNGGLAGNIFWESENLKHLFPVGEVNGTHGVTRPGGSALNSGQAGALRAAEFIFRKYSDHTFDPAEFEKIAGKELAKLLSLKEIEPGASWQTERMEFQSRMSEAGAFVRSRDLVDKALSAARQQLERLEKSGLKGLSGREMMETMQNRQLCLAHWFYLSAAAAQIEYVGSRGGSLVLAADGEPIGEGLAEKWRMVPEKREFRNYQFTSVLDGDGNIATAYEKCRAIPEVNGWFEKVWSDFRNNKLWEIKE